MENIIWVVLLCAVLALLFAAWKTSAVSKADAGTGTDEGDRGKHQ